MHGNILKSTLLYLLKLWTGFNLKFIIFTSIFIGKPFIRARSLINLSSELSSLESEHTKLALFIKYLKFVNL